MTIILLCFAAIVFLYIAAPYQKEELDELERLKLDILGSMAKDKEEERRARAVESIVLYDSPVTKKKPFTIDNEGNVNYIEWEEVKG